MFVFITFCIASFFMPFKKGYFQRTRSFRTKHDVENLKFYHGGTLTEVIERAEKENKLVFVDFTAVWCAPCRIMEEEVYTYKGFYELYNENFINYRIDIEKKMGPIIALLYEVKTLSTLLFLDTKGRAVLKTLVTSLYVELSVW